jgi:UDP-N-acetylglucosamine 2-epimerase (non-hydrolysing)
MGDKITLTAVVGGRPNIMKMAPVLRGLEAHNRTAGPRLAVRLVHTGAANDPRLNDTSWGDVHMPAPELHLGVAGGSPAEQCARMLSALDRHFAAEPSDGVLVAGDGEAALAGALAAAKRRLPVFHIEAGLRARDRSLPEEINRTVIDALSTLLFTPSPDASANLLREGRPPEQVVCAGNVMIDNLLYHLQRCRESDVLERLGLAAGVGYGGVAVAPRYVVLILYRAENTSSREVLAGILKTLSGVARGVPVIFPVSPLLRKKLEDWGLDDYYTDLTARLESFGGASPGLPTGLYIVPPIPYLDFLRLFGSAEAVVTDSGGVQEETTALGIPCLTLRDETDRPITVTEGSNRLVGRDRERLRVELLAALGGHGKHGRVPAQWDGRAAGRIVNALAAYYRREGR